MPPIRSSRPGARAAVTGAGRSKKSGGAFTVALKRVTSGGDVLGREEEHTSGLPGAEELSRHRIVYGGKHVPRARKKTREAAVTLRDRRRARRSRGERRGTARDPVESLAADVVASRP